MGCCGGAQRDEAIMNTTNMDELINVMKKKKNDIPIEKKEIQDHLVDPSKKIGVVTFMDCTKEALEKRLPYLDRISDCYGECIEKLETVPGLPFQEAKEHMFNIVKHYLITYDDTNQYTNDLAAFKQFAFKYEKGNK